MKQKYEVSYYEYGLTNRIVKMFHHYPLAHLYALYIYYRYKEARPNLRIYER